VRRRVAQPHARPPGRALLGDDSVSDSLGAAAASGLPADRAFGLRPAGFLRAAVPQARPLGQCRGRVPRAGRGNGSHRPRDQNASPVSERIRPRHRGAGRSGVPSRLLPCAEPAFLLARTALGLVRRLPPRDDRRLPAPAPGDAAYTRRGRVDLPPSRVVRRGGRRHPRALRPGDRAGAVPIGDAESGLHRPPRHRPGRPIPCDRPGAARPAAGGGRHAVRRHVGHLPARRDRLPGGSAMAGVSEPGRGGRGRGDSFRGVAPGTGADLLRAEGPPGGRRGAALSVPAPPAAAGAPAAARLGRPALPAARRRVFRGTA